MTNPIEGTIFSQCIVDVDNRYVDISLTPNKLYQNQVFLLKVSDTSSNGSGDIIVELLLTRSQVELIAHRMQSMLAAYPEVDSI
jgi:hypothetical protein